MNLHDAHILVTGGSKGLGAALAHEFAGRGARLTLIARPSAELDAVAKETGGLALPVDLSDLDNLDEVVARAEDRNGPLDVLVNNAALIKIDAFGSLSKTDMRTQVCTNLLAPMELARQALTGMLSRNRGVIVNVSSVSASVSVPNVSCYSVPKTGLSKFTVDLQTELKGSGVRALLVTLGAVAGTPMIQQFEADPRISGIVRRIKTLTSDPKDVARRIAEGVADDKRRMVTVPRVASVVVGLNLIPTRLASGLISVMTRS